MDCGGEGRDDPVILKAVEFSLLEVYLHIQSLKEIKDFKLSM